MNRLKRQTAVCNERKRKASDARIKELPRRFRNKNQARGYNATDNRWPKESASEKLKFTGRSRGHQATPFFLSFADLTQKERAWRR